LSMGVIRTRLNTSFGSHTAYHLSVMVSFINRPQGYVPCPLQSHGLVFLLTRLPLTGLRCGACVARAAAAWRILRYLHMRLEGYDPSYCRGGLALYLRPQSDVATHAGSERDCGRRASHRHRDPGWNSLLVSLCFAWALDGSWDNHAAVAERR
jgi:hypothetical protein